MKDWDNLEEMKDSHTGIYILHPDTNAEALERGRMSAEMVRQALEDSVDGSLEEGMSSLRGRIRS